MEEIYISTDIEADGPIPGPYSMLSLGSAAFTADKQLLGTFSVNLETLPGATALPETAAWWATQPAAWAACRVDPQPPEVAMERYIAWIEALPGKPVFVGYPAGFDFLFVYWYLIRFAGRSPYGFSALDIKSCAMAVMRKPYRRSVKRNMPPIRSRIPISHWTTRWAREPCSATSCGRTWLISCQHPPRCSWPPASLRWKTSRADLDRDRVQQAQSAS